MNEQATPNASANRVRVLGDFERIDHSVPGDASGYLLQLWRQGNQIYGLFAVYVGPAGDPPTGILEDIRFDPSARRLSFKARLSTGLTYGRGYQGSPSRDIFQFKGRLLRNHVTGILIKSNDLFPNDKPKMKRITLRRSADMSQLMDEEQNYEDWKKSVDKILQRLGPKW